MYEKELKIAIEAVKSAEPTFRKYFGTRTKVEIKGGNYRDLVSYADKKIQREIKAFLKKRFPGTGFIGEENNETESDSGTAWVLDPIDGTGNYLRGLPDCSISLALMANGKFVAGVVYAPFLGKIYTAAKGTGANLNNRPIRVRGVKQPDKAFGGMGWGRNVKFARNLFPKLVSTVMKLRVPASASLGICYTAQGSYDFFVDREMKIWDYAASSIILEEAGGELILSKKPQLQVAANPFLARKIFHVAKKIL